MKLYQIFEPVLEGTSVKFLPACRRATLISAIAAADVRKGYAVFTDGQDNKQVTPNFFFGSELESEMQARIKLETARKSYPEWVEKQCFVHASWA